MIEGLDLYFKDDKIPDISQAMRDTVLPSVQNQILEKTNKKAKRNFEIYVKQQSDPHKVARSKILLRMQQKLQKKKSAL